MPEHICYEKGAIIIQMRTSAMWLILGGVGLASAALALTGYRYYEQVQAGPVTPVTKIDSRELWNPVEKIFKRGRRDRKEVCLTFDDGPHPQSVKEILDILKVYDVRATFFLVGRRIEQYPEQVREIVREGHEVGNHTENHLRLDTLSPDQVRTELSMCEKAYSQATGGDKLVLFRPPGMRFNADVLKIAREFGYITVDWNYGAKDFQPMDADRIAEYVLQQVTNGGIILLHDNPATARALPEILLGLKQKGFAVKTVGEMLRDLPDPVDVSTVGKLGEYKPER